MCTLFSGNIRSDLERCTNNVAEEVGNKAAGWRYGMNESCIREWRLFLHKNCSIFRCSCFRGLWHNFLSFLGWYNWGCCVKQGRIWYLGALLSYWISSHHMIPAHLPLGVSVSVVSGNAAGMLYWLLNWEVKIALLKQLMNKTVLVQTKRSTASDLVACHFGSPRWAETIVVFLHFSRALSIIISTLQLKCNALDSNS